MMTAMSDNLFTREVTNDPYTYFGRLREEDPVHWNEPCELWVITRHDDLVWLTRHHELFSSEVLKRDPRPPYPQVDAADLGLYEYVRDFSSDQFIQHDRPEVREQQGLAPEVIQRATRRGHDDVHSPPKTADLLVERRPAVDRQDACPQHPAVAVKRLRHLHRELTGGHQDENGRAGGWCGFRAEALQQREGERRGLARSGRGLAQEVPTGEKRRDGLLLDRSGLLVSQRRERLQQRRAEAEVREGKHARNVAVRERRERLVGREGRVVPEQQLQTT